MRKLSPLVVLSLLLGVQSVRAAPVRWQEVVNSGATQSQAGQEEQTSTSGSRCTPLERKFPHLGIPLWPLLAPFAAVPFTFGFVPFDVPQDPDTRIILISDPFIPTPNPTPNPAPVPEPLALPLFAAALTALLALHKRRSLLQR